MTIETLETVLFVLAIAIYAIFIMLMLGWGCFTAWYYVTERDDWTGELERDKRVLVTSISLFVFATFLIILGAYTLMIRMGR